MPSQVLVELIVGHVDQPTIAHVDKPTIGRVGHPVQGSVVAESSIDHVGQSTIGHVDQPTGGHTIGQPTDGYNVGKVTDIGHFGRRTDGPSYPPTDGHISQMHLNDESNYNEILGKLRYGGRYEVSLSDPGLITYRKRRCIGYFQRGEYASNCLSAIVVSARLVFK